MESLATSPEVTYNWVDITSDFFKCIQGKCNGTLSLTEKVFYDIKKK